MQTAIKKVHALLPFSEEDAHRLRPLSKISFRNCTTIIANDPTSLSIDHPTNCHVRC